MSNAFKARGGIPSSEMAAIAAQEGIFVNPEALERRRLEVAAMRERGAGVAEILEAFPRESTRE